jgi:hypothetical protein
VLHGLQSRPCASLDALEATLKALGNFDASLSAYGERFDALENQASEFEADGHMHASTMTARAERVLSRHAQVMTGVRVFGSRIDALLGWLALQRDCLEVQAWISEKTAVAITPAHLDASANLARKLQRHSALEAEVVATAKRLEALHGEATFLTHTHDAVMAGKSTDDRQDVSGAVVTVRAMLAGVQAGYEALLQHCTSRKALLLQAIAAKSVMAYFDEHANWLERKHVVLSSRAVGADLSAARRLVTDTQLSVGDVAGYEGRVDTSVQDAKTLQDNGNFRGVDVVARAADISALYVLPFVLLF